MIMNLWVCTLKMEFMYNHNFCMNFAFSRMRSWSVILTVLTVLVMFKIFSMDAREVGHDKMFTFLWETGNGNQELDHFPLLTKVGSKLAKIYLILFKIFPHFLVLLIRKLVSFPVPDCKLKNHSFELVLWKINLSTSRYSTVPIKVEILKLRRTK